MPKPSADSFPRALSLALSRLGGAMLVLDDALAVRGFSAEATQVLGFTPALGVPAAKLLCGARVVRPVAEALEAGRPIRTVIAHPGKFGERGAEWLRVTATPLVPDDDASGSPGAWLLALEASPAPDEEGAVDFQGVLTRNIQMKRLFQLVERAAQSDAPILVRGETGSGKELVARAVHDLSDRKKGPFRAINCAALPANLLESELFGHVRGAFTGAVKDTPGHLQLAHRGTLFLDEVAELPLELQAKLLRVLETQSFIPVGAREPIPVDVRVVSATHRALRREVEAGRFRADLMFRLRVIPIFIPPLRERSEDVELLAMHFLAALNAKKKRVVTRLQPAALQALRRYDWPGNVRELRNVLAYAFAMGDGDTLLLRDLPAEVMETQVQELDAGGPPPASPFEHLSGEPRRIAEVLQRVGGSRERAAKVLGISRITLWRRMKEFGLADA